MVNQFYDVGSFKRPRTKISKFTETRTNHQVTHADLFPTRISAFYNSNTVIGTEISSIPQDDPDILSHISTGAKAEIITGSHSGMNRLQLFRKYEDELQTFIDWIYSCLDYTHPGLEIHQSWINISTGDAFQIAHTHAHSTVSGIYYHETDVNNHGGIVFNNPNPFSKMDMWGTESARHFPATPNTLILFPSWLEHKTVKSRINTPRISIAFNAR
jgi:uncharacterized protein (TIGR02466 family)